MRLATAFETSVVASVIATVVRASAATVIAAASAPAAMGTAAATTAVASPTTMLSECRNWHESKTGESSKCDQGSEKSKSAHNPYLRSKRRTFEREPMPKGRRAPTN